MLDSVGQPAVSPRRPLESCVTLVEAIEAGWTVTEIFTWEYQVLRRETHRAFVLSWVERHRLSGWFL